MLTVIVHEPTSYEEILADILADGPSYGMWPDGERFWPTAFEAARAVHDRCVRTCNAWKKFAEEMNR